MSSATPAPDNTPEPQDVAIEDVDLAAALSAQGDQPEATPDSPAPDAPPATEPESDTPSAPAPAPTPDPRDTELAQLRAEKAAFDRREATLRGQVANAAKQAEAKARADMEADERKRITAELDAAERSGQYDQSAIEQRRAQYQAQWDREDLTAKQAEVASQQEAIQQGMTAMQAQTLVHEARTIAENIPQRAAEVFAQQHDLPVDVVRAFLDKPAIKSNATKAYLQSSLYGTDTFSLYMDSLGDQLAIVKEREALKATQQRDSNRDAAAASGAHAPPPALVGGGRPAPRTIEEAGAELERRLRAT